ncbi:MAG: antitoxin family protein [Nanoarchaeota archaeon]
MEIKFNNVYKKGVLIPKNPLNLEEDTEVKVVLKDDLFNYFSIAGQEDDVEKFSSAQKEIIQDD